MNKYMLLLLLSSCGYQVPKDQCIGKGTECHGEASDVGSSAGNSPSSQPGPVQPSPIPGPPGRDGERGPQGNAGQDGIRGNDGEGCTVTQGVGQATISCEDGTSAIVTSGQDGSDAPIGPYNIVGLVDPCGDKAGTIDEVFLRLANGLLVVLFADNAHGDNPRLSVVPPGNYLTTDGSLCYFTVDAQYQLVNEHY